MRCEISRFLLEFGVLSAVIHGRLYQGLRYVGRGLWKDEIEWTEKTETRNEQFLSVDEACIAIFCPTAAFKNLVS